MGEGGGEAGAAHGNCLAIAMRFWYFAAARRLGVFVFVVALLLRVSLLRK